MDTPATSAIVGDRPSCASARAAASTGALDAALDRHFAAEEAQDVDGILATPTPDAVGDPALRFRVLGAVVQ